ncbi:hypothetical protein [Amycolatopsis keratiniphila]|uniref:hypothetical protein n=1 Tax=Amycolatopsis keratiniphila TaxID=129921 RepID=UPI003F4D3C67
MTSVKFQTWIPLSMPWSRRSLLGTGSCQDGRRPTSVCRRQILLGGAFVSMVLPWHESGAGDVVVACAGATAPPSRPIVTGRASAAVR